MSPFRPLALAAAFATVLPTLAPAQDGTLDPTFGIAGKQRVVFDRPPDADDLATAASVQPDGRILVAGKVCATFTDCFVGAARLLPGGGLDATFNADGQAAFDGHPDATISHPAAILARPDGRVWIVSHVLTGAGGFVGLVRLTADGLFDSSFGDPGTPGRALRTVPGGTIGVGASAALLQADGKLVVGGSGQQAGFTDSDFFVARFTATGSLDPTFGGGDGVIWVAFDHGGGNHDSLDDLVAAGAGFYVAGQISAGPTDRDTGVARLTSAGVLDTAFGGDGRVEWEADDLFGDLQDSNPIGLRRQPDGRLLLVGTAIDPADGSHQVFLGRLLVDGSYDPTLTVAMLDLLPGAGDETALGVDVQADRKLVVAARVVGECLVARFDANGAALDPTFAAGGVAHVTGWLGDAATCTELAATPRGPLAIGITTDADSDFLVAQIRATFFRDGFASGNTGRWSSTQP